MKYFYQFTIEIFKIKILATLLVILLFSITAFSQKDPCEPQCNIYFNDIFRMRCPDEATVAKLNNLTVSEYSFNPDYVKLGGPHCGDKVVALLKKFREEDATQEKVLRGRYCSAQEGWVPARGKDCIHGGPPPCCTAPEETRPWEKIDPLQALNQFKEEQEKIYQKRLREISDIVKPCKIQSVNDNKFDFDNSYEVAIDLINKFRDEYPSEYANVQNSHGSKISQLKKQYDIEVSKQEKADIQKLSQLVKSIKEEEQALSKLSEKAAQEKDKVEKENKKIIAQETITEKKITEKKITEEKITEEKTAKGKTAKKDSKAKSDTKKDKSSSSSTYVESDYAREMRLRREAQYSKDTTENKIMGAAMVATEVAMGTAMVSNLDNDDEDDETPVYLKGTIGLGLQQIPITKNMTYGYNDYVTGVTTYKNESHKGSTNHYSINAGLLFAVLNDRFVSLRLNPFITYGMNAFDNGISGNHINYGSGAALAFGRKIKLLLKGEFVQRTGDLTEDNAVIGIDAKGYSKYNYSTLKYGAGAYWGFGGHDAFAEISAYRENISFLKSINAEVYSYEAKVSFSLLAFSVQYASNYPIAGELKYPKTYQKEKEDFLNFTLYVPFKIFSTY